MLFYNKLGIVYLTKRSSLEKRPFQVTIKWIYKIYSSYRENSSSKKLKILEQQSLFGGGGGGRCLLWKRKRNRFFQRMLKINLCVLLHFKGSKKVKNHSTIFENEKVEDCPHVKLVKTAQNKSFV